MSALTRSREHIRSLVCGYPRRLRESKILVALNAYVDDSGNEPTELAFVLAGYISTAELWERFSDAWDAECSKAPVIEHFKMRDAKHRLNSFKGWTKDQVNERLMTLANIVQEHTLIRVDTFIPWPPYQKFLSQLPGELSNPYFLLFYQTIIGTASWMIRNSRDGTVDFVFDEQGKFGRECLKFWDMMLAFAPPQIRERIGATPIFRDDKKVVPLQAADMLAWNIRRLINDRTIKNAEPSQLMSFLLEKTPISKQLTFDEIRMIARRINDRLGQARAAGS